jgi:biopolymer transport protein ExbD
MPKVKVPRKSTSVDMTAMTDVAFLLLTFFMLATKFKPDEPVIVDTPSSISEIKLPDVDIMMITIDKENRVFFGIDGQQKRTEMLDRMATKYNLKFTENQKKEFSLLTTFGVPIEQLGQLLDMPAADRLKIKQPGIPCDSVKNELTDWVWNARLVNNNIRVAVKGDQLTGYPVVKQVMNTLQERNVNRFNFITSMERSLD